MLECGDMMFNIGRYYPKKKKKNFDTASKSSTWLSTIDYARLTMFSFALFLKDFKTICSSFSMSLPN